MQADRMTRVRWWVLSLLFFGTTLNYLDRIVFPTLITEIRAEIRLDPETYGWVNGAFTVAYMIGFLAVGKFIDRYGTRIGYAAALAGWSLAAALHGLAHNAVSLGFWRGMLGLAEAGNFPASIRSVAEWFPKRDRALATGLFNAGSNVASTVGPFLIAWLGLAYGWRACFFAIGSLGFILLALWLWTYRTPDRHARVNKAELAYIRSDPDEERQPDVGWLAALGHRETWGFAVAKFLTDPVWWFYLWWLVPYLRDVRHVTLLDLRWMLLFAYTMASVGSIAGGWLSGLLIRRGWAVSRARKTALLACAAALPVSATAVFAPGVWGVVGLVSIALGAHQGWSANLFTTTSDVFPKNAVASVVGIGGCAGALGGIVFSTVVPGIIIQNFGYTPVFVSMGFFHLTALAFLHWLMGDLKRISVAPAQTA